MAQQIINIGAAPNDKSGTKLRNAFNAINTMFTEVYSTLQTLTGGQALKAALTQVLRVDAESVLTAQQKLRAALNAGSLLPLTAELVAPTAHLAAGTFFAFTLPQAFLLYSSTLTVCDAESGASLTAALEKQNGDGSWTAIHNATGSVTNRRMDLGTSSEGVSIPAGTSLRVNLSAAMDGYAGDTMGLAVWLRGVWA